MILLIKVTNFDCFDKFIKKAISLDIPFHVIAYHKDVTPIENFYGKNHPPKNFTIRLVLCCSIFTVLLDTFLPVEEIDAFAKRLATYNAEEFDNISIKDGVILCE